VANVIFLGCLSFNTYPRGYKKGLCCAARIIHNLQGKKNREEGGRPLWGKLARQGVRGLGSQNQTLLDTQKHHRKMGDDLTL
jgi:hypothetical protein